MERNLRAVDSISKFKRSIPSVDSWVLILLRRQYPLAASIALFSEKFSLHLSWERRFFVGFDHSWSSIHALRRVFKDRSIFFNPINLFLGWRLMGLISTFNSSNVSAHPFGVMYFFLLACVFVSVISFIQIQIPPIATLGYYFLAMGLTMKIYAILGGIQTLQIFSNNFFVILFFSILNFSCSGFVTETWFFGVRWRLADGDIVAWVIPVMW